MVLVMKTTDRPAIDTVVVIDASFMIGICARERDKHDQARTLLEEYQDSHCRLYAPGVMLTECCFVLCKKKRDGEIGAADHTLAVESLIMSMKGVSPTPCNESDLIRRADFFAEPYGCNFVNDSMYLALAEYLSLSGPTDLLTFDKKMHDRATNLAPAIRSRLLIAQQD